MPSRNSKKHLHQTKINSFLEEYQPQIKEIRLAVLRSLCSLLVGGVLGLIYSRQIILKLFSFFNLENINLVLTSPYQFVNLAITLAIICGLLLATPVFIFDILKYLRPALLESEYDLIKKMIPTGLFLFLIGCLFGGYLEQFIITIYSQATKDFAIGNMWDVENFLFQLIIMSFTMGLVFQMPIILTILIRLKVVTVNFLQRQRRYFYVFLVIFAILLPPTDVFSLLLIIIPLFLLFEGTLLLNKNK